jgi:iron complex outermembrane receptor protein
MKFQKTKIVQAVSAALLLLNLPTNAMAQSSTPSADTQTVSVTGIRASLQKSIDAKKNADTNVEVVTAEDIGKMPDKNIADALIARP